MELRCLADFHQRRSQKPEGHRGNIVRSSAIAKAPSTASIRPSRKAAIRLSDSRSQAASNSAGRRERLSRSRSASTARSLSGSWRASFSMIAASMILKIPHQFPRGNFQVTLGDDSNSRSAALPTTKVFLSPSKIPSSLRCSMLGFDVRCSTSLPPAPSSASPSLIPSPCWRLSTGEHGCESVSNDPIH